MLRSPNSKIRPTKHRLREYIWTEFGDQKDARDSDNSCRSHFGTTGMQYMHILVGSCRGCQQDRATSFLWLSRRERETALELQKSTATSSDFSEGKISSQRYDLALSYRSDWLPVFILYLGLCVVVWLCLVACILRRIAQCSKQAKCKTSTPYCLMQVCTSRHAYKNEIFLSSHLSNRNMISHLEMEVHTCSEMRTTKQNFIKSGLPMLNFFLYVGLGYAAWSILMQSKAHVSN